MMVSIRSKLKFEKQGTMIWTVGLGCKLLPAGRICNPVHKCRDTRGSHLILFLVWGLCAFHQCTMWFTIIQVGVKSPQKVLLRNSITNLWVSSSRPSSLCRMEDTLCGAGAHQHHVKKKCRLAFVKEKKTNFCE